MAIKTGKDELYFKYFQQLFETIEKDPEINSGHPIKNLSYINTNPKEKEFVSYINRFLNEKLNENHN